MATVTLLKNPPPSAPASNPRKRRRRHRNPNGFGVRTITREFPPLEEVGGSFLGFATALQGPNLLQSTRWMNVLWSAVFTAGGAVALRMFRAGQRVSNGFALGGSLATLGKAAHVATNGQFGVPTTLTVVPQFQPQAAEDVTGLPAGGRNAVSPTGVLNVGAFRESQFAGGGSDVEDTLLT